MVNPSLFSGSPGTLLPQVNARNHHGAGAYAFSAKHQLAQLAATGCLNNTFYADAENQLVQVLALAQQVDARFVAQTALYARQSGHMKDMPALLAATLVVRDVQLLRQIFPRVIDNGKMLRNFVQIVRSGVLGRKSLGTRPKKLVQQWLLHATEKQLLAAAVGQQPSLADVVKMVHPKPAEAWRAAWFAWLLSKPHAQQALPPVTQAFERFKRAAAAGQDLGSMPLPEVPLQMLTALPLGTRARAQVAQNLSWQALRQHFNTCARQGVFDLPGLPEAIAARLRDSTSIARARVMPYQLMAAYAASIGKVPAVVSAALQDAMEQALAHVPEIAGTVAVCPDVSPSMHAPATGRRKGATSVVRCIDVAALVAAAVLRKNPGAHVLPFEVDVVDLHLNPRDSVMTNAQRLASIQGRGTNCSAPLAWLNRKNIAPDVLILVSDNESWVDARQLGATQTMREWALLRQRNPAAKLVCMDIQPHTTTQAAERDDILNIGGFSDAVFQMLAHFAQGHMAATHWVGEIEKVRWDNPGLIQDKPAVQAKFPREC